MQETEPSAGLSAELIDDFFAEADEHLLSVREALVHLEGSVGKAQAEPAIVESLFRNFHSFKGISAIVGLGAAEAVAHATEDFLRLMRGGKCQLSGKGLEVLTDAARKLEQIVAAFRLKKPLPTHDFLLADLKAQCAAAAQPANAKSTLQAHPADSTMLARIEDARAQGLLLWKYTFTPSTELNARGVNIVTVREQLLRVGEILKSTPVVKGPGKIDFEFLLAALEAPTDIADWEAKGVVVQPAGLEKLESPTQSTAENSSSKEETHSPFLAPSHVVRVDLKHLDELMRITGEMVIHRSRLEAQLARLNRATGQVDLRAVQEVSGGLSRSLRELREAISRVRLVPMAEIFARMPFVVRDLEQQTQKKVRLELYGQDTAIDKYIIERLKDPLLHLIRNAFSHGVETQGERLAAGKPAEATIQLKASTVGDSVIIQIQDDGRGISFKAIVRQAEKVGLELPAVAENESILKILCSPGFSTRNDADRLSGRGVGMAVVMTTVNELGGMLSLKTEEGRGTQFTLRLPLTLAIVEVVIVKAAGQTCAVPQSFVHELVQTSELDIQMVNGIEVIPYRSGVLPVLRLAGLFGLKSIKKSKMCLLVISSDRGRVGLVTEEVLGQQEVVVRALRDPLIQVPGITGATELGDGKPILILDGAALTAGNVLPEVNWKQSKNQSIEMNR